MFLFSFTKRRAREERRQKTFAHLPPPLPPLSPTGARKEAGRERQREKKGRGGGMETHKEEADDETRTAYKHCCALETQTFIIKRLSRNLSSAQ